MALYKNEATSSLQDLLTKLDAFLTTAGAGNPAWTAEDTDGLGNSLNTTTGVWAISKTASSGEHVQIAAQWDTTSPNNLGLYQYLDAGGPGSFVRTNNPWGQTADSGNGYAGTADASLDTGRYVPIGNSPIQYWAFVGDTYAHIVVETATDTFVHFGFGELDMFNDWTGGAYCYGYRYYGGVNSNVAVQRQSSNLLDGISYGSTAPAMADFVATMHAESLSDSPGSGIWAVVMGNQVAAYLGQDRQGTPADRIHILGGFRAGYHAQGFGSFVGLITQGLIGSYPIVCYHWDRDVSGSSLYPNSVTPLGSMLDCRGISMKNFVARDEVVIGSDTWTIFPTRKRGDTGSLTNTTGWQGIMYKQN